MQSFYKSKPKQDAPYRLLALFADDKGKWWVRLSAGVKWGRDNAAEVRKVSVKGFDDGENVYNVMYNELVATGWRPPSPGQTWG